MKSFQYRFTVVGVLWGSFVFIIALALAGHMLFRLAVSSERMLTVPMDDRPMVPHCKQWLAQYPASAYNTCQRRFYIYWNWATSESGGSR